MRPPYSLCSQSNEMIHPLRIIFQVWKCRTPQYLSCRMCVLLLHGVVLRTRNHEASPRRHLCGVSSSTACINNYLPSHNLLAHVHQDVTSNSPILSTARASDAGTFHQAPTQTARTAKRKSTVLCVSIFTREGIAYSFHSLWFACTRMQPG